MKRFLFAIIFIILLLSLSAVQRQMVVVEIGTGTWCQYCPGAAMGADDLVNNHKRAAIVEYHNGDNYANTYSDARNNYYALTGFPTAQFDGLNPSVGGSHTNSMYSSYLPKVNSRLNVPSHYTIDATGTLENGTYTVNVTVTKTEADANTNLVLHGVMTQSGIQVNWQGQTHLEFVERQMSPSQTGTPMNFSTNNTQTATLTFTPGAGMTAEHLEFIFFLQNNSSKEIMQGMKYSHNALLNTPPVETTSIDFGTIDQGSADAREIVIHNWWGTDMTGSITVDNPALFIIPGGRDDFTIPFMADSTFSVFFTPTTAGAFSANITITTDNPTYPTITIPVTATVNGTGVEDGTNVAVAAITNYPNPFNRNTTIQYVQKLNATMRIDIYNTRGQLVRTLQPETVTSGLHTMSWDGNDGNGNAVTQGLYFARISANGQSTGYHKMLKF